MSSRFLVEYIVIGSLHGLQILSALEDQPNYFTFLLSRPELGVNPGGVFTICTSRMRLSSCDQD